MTNQDIINAEIQKGNSVKIKLKNPCNQSSCCNTPCSDAGIRQTYDVLFQGSWSKCLIALEDMSSKSSIKILQHCSLSVADGYDDEYITSIESSSDGFIINMDDGSYLFVDRSNVESVMTYPKPGAKTIMFNNDGAPKKRKLFGKTVIKNIKSP